MRIIVGSPLKLLLLQLLLQFVAATNPFSESDKHAFVLVHNRLRQTRYPHFMANNYITWDDQLANLATVELNDGCKVNQSRIADAFRHHIIANVYVGPQSTASPYNVTMSWFAELNYIGHTNSSTLLPKPGCNIDNYIHLMTPAATSFGCNYKDCSNARRIVTCHYSLDHSSSERYKPGRLCSKCPKRAPLCLVGLCISEVLAQSAEFKRFDSTAKPECKLECEFCGRVNSTGGGCSCDCSSAMGTGEFCDDGLDPTKACDPCLGAPNCSNGGAKFQSLKYPMARPCSCRCSEAYVGAQCEFRADAHINSLWMVLGSDRLFDNGSVSVLPPVSKSQFNTEIWNPRFRSGIANAINAFCRIRQNFGLCCLGRALPAGSIGQKVYIVGDNVRHFHGTVGGIMGGRLQFVFYIELPNNSELCADAARSPSVGRPAATTDYVRPEVIWMAIKRFANLIKESLPLSVRNVSIMHLDSRSDFGDFYEAARSVAVNKFSTDFYVASNITGCPDPPLNISDSSGTDESLTASRCLLILTLLPFIFVEVSVAF